MWHLLCCQASDSPVTLHESVPVGISYQILNMLCIVNVLSKFEAWCMLRAAGRHFSSRKRQQYHACSVFVVWTLLGPPSLIGASIV